MADARITESLCTAVRIVTQSKEVTYLDWQEQTAGEASVSSFSFPSGVYTCIARYDIMDGVGEISFMLPLHYLVVKTGSTLYDSSFGVSRGLRPGHTPMLFAGKRW